MEDLRGYEKLNVYERAHKLAVKIHRMSVELPKFEMYEEGSQIRRSSKSISANIVEGYALRNYKSEYIHYLYRAYASCEETNEHLRYLYETKSLKSKSLYEDLKKENIELSKMMYSFIKGVEREHRSKK